MAMGEVELPLSIPLEAKFWAETTCYYNERKTDTDVNSDCALLCDVLSCNG